MLLGLSLDPPYSCIFVTFTHRHMYWPECLFSQCWDLTMLRFLSNYTQILPEAPIHRYRFCKGSSVSLVKSRICYTSVWQQNRLHFLGNAFANSVHPGCFGALTEVTLCGVKYMETDCTWPHLTTMLCSETHSKVVDSLPVILFSFTRASFQINLSSVTILLYHFPTLSRLFSSQSYIWPIPLPIWILTLFNSLSFSDLLFPYFTDSLQLILIGLSTHHSCWNPLPINWPLLLALYAF